MAEPPAARVSRGGVATLLFGPNFWERRGTRWGATSRSSFRLPPGQWLGSFAADGLALALARRWHVAHAAASGGVLVFMASREEVVPDLRGW